PADSELARRREVGFVAFGRAGVDPAGDELLVFFAEAGVVDEVAVFGISVPGRHALLVNDLANHLGPADDFVVAGECEGSDLAGAMTLDAVVLQDAGNVFGIGYGFAGGQSPPYEEAADEA